MKISCPSCGASFNIKLEALGASGRKVKCGKCAHQWHCLPDGSAAVRPPERKASATPPPPLPTPAVTPRATPAPTRPIAPDAADSDDNTIPVPDAATAKSEPETAESVIAPARGAANIEVEPRPGQDVPVAPAMFATGGAEAMGAGPSPDGSDDTAKPGFAPDTEAGNAASSLARRIAVSALAAAAAVIILGGGAIFLQPQITGMVPAAAALYASMGLQSDIPGLGLKIVEPIPRKLIEGDDEILEVVGEIRNETKNPQQIPVMQARLLDDDGEALEVWYFRAAKPQIAPGEAVQYKTEFRNPPKLAERLDITFTRRESTATGQPEMARKRPPRMEKPDPAR